MSRALNIAATGMLAQQTNVEVISNNIANINTNAFKREAVAFQTLLYEHQTRAGSASSDAGTTIPTGIQKGLGVNVGAIYRINEQGNPTETNNSFDLLIRGKGHFIVQTPEGEDVYTRDGTFQLSKDGEIVTHKGYVVQPGITIPTDAMSVEISDNGTVSVKLPQQIDLQEVGRLELATFINPSGLEAIGDNLLKATTASGDPVTGNPDEDDFGSILQGWLEGSNVDPVKEITNLIKAQRGYEMGSKVISTSDEMMQSANNSKR